MKVEFQNSIRLVINPSLTTSRLQLLPTNSVRITTEKHCFSMKPIVNFVDKLVGKSTKKPDNVHPLTSKVSSRQKTNERSSRSIKRKLDLEKYTSESLEKLNFSHRASE
jgi:hypothetical protein